MNAQDLPVAVLTVCTGNLARSVMSAQMLAARLGGRGVAVSSAGTHAQAGDPMTAQAAEQSRKYGADAEGHSARFLTADIVAGSELVVTATRQHRADVVSLVPRASRYAFTLKQFARIVESLDTTVPLVGGSPAEKFRAFVALAAAHRGFLPPLEDPAGDDLVDPYLQAQSVYDRVGAEIDHAVTTIVSTFEVMSAGSEPPRAP